MTTRFDYDQLEADAKTAPQIAEELRASTRVQLAAVDNREMTQEELDAEEAGDAEAAMLELANEPTSWQKMSTPMMREILKGEHKPTLPTVFKRTDDEQPLLYRSRVNMFLGEPEGAKTFAALVAITQEIEAGNVVMLVDLEDAFETTAERLQQLGLSDEQIEEHLYYATPDSEFDATAAANIEVDIREMCAKTGGEFTLAAIDSMTEAMSIQNLDPDRGTDVTKLYHGIAQFLTRLKAAVVIIDHVVKSNDARGRWAIGSERKISGINGAAYAFTAEQNFGRGQVGKIKLTIAKDRPGYMRALGVGTGKKKTIANLTLVSSPVTSKITATLSAPTPLHAPAELSSALERRKVAACEAVREAGTGISATDLKAAMPGQNEGKATEIQGMVDEGLFRVEVGSGNRKTYYPNAS